MADGEKLVMVSYGEHCSLDIFCGGGWRKLSAHQGKHRLLPVPFWDPKNATSGATC
jgi:hypothetical protein